MAGVGKSQDRLMPPHPIPSSSRTKGQIRSQVTVNFAYRTPHLLEIQAVNHTRELTDFFSSQVVTLLLLKCLFVFKLWNRYNIENRWDILTSPRSPMKTLQSLRGKSPTDLTVHIVSMLGSNNGDVAFIQGIAVGLGSLPRPFVQNLEQRKMCVDKSLLSDTTKKKVVKSRWKIYV